MNTQAPLARVEPASTTAADAFARPFRYAAGVAALALAYYGAAKAGQSLRYTASVSAVWPPAGLGIGALYLWGLRWWPGIFAGELLVNTELVVSNTSLPLGSVIGQQAGNMAEILVGAVLLQRLIGRRAGLDRASQVGGMLVALGAATAVSATVGSISMLAGGVIDISELRTFWRTWWLGDTAGGLVVLPLMLAWARDPVAAWRRLRTVEGVLMIAAVIVLATVAVSSGAPLTYMVFPALIWAAFRFGPTGTTLSTAIVALLTIGLTADHVGLFSKQPINNRTLGTQLYLLVAGITALFLSAVVSERERAARDLAEAKRREGEGALEERHRIARDLHDSVSQALFSTLLQTRAAQRALARERVGASSALARALAAIGELVRGAQSEMRALIFELGSNPMEDGLVAAFAKHAWTVSDREHLRIELDGPREPLPLSSRSQAELFAIGREALSNVVRHANASEAWIRVEAAAERVSVAIGDDGRGFENVAQPAGHFGLASMRSRAVEIGGVLTITSSPGSGTVVRVDVPTEHDGDANGA